MTTMKKRTTIVRTFEDREFLSFIIKRGATLTCRSDREPLYAENAYERFVSAERWGLEPYQLAAFMKDAGEQYSYISPASFASSLYRKDFQRERNVLRQGDYRAIACRDALYGGRCEVYRSGLSHAISYDINSSYPNEAKSLRFGYAHSLEYCKPTYRNIYDYEGVSNVTFSQSGFRPILPIRHDGRTIYAETDRCRGWFTHTELRYALSKGVSAIALHKQFIAQREMDYNPYDAFVAYCFERRWKTGIKTWKHALNAFFGRLATLSNELLRFRPAKSHKELKETPQYRKTYFGDKVKMTGIACVADVLPSPPNGNVFDAAMILSSARIRIHELCEKYDALYVDTDGIITQRRDVPIGREDELGALKIAKEGTFIIKGGKEYLFTNSEEESIIMKGKSKLYRTKMDLLAARLTNERIKNEDDSTMPYQLSFITSDSRLCAPGIRADTNAAHYANTSIYAE